MIAKRPAGSPEVVTSETRWLRRELGARIRRFGYRPDDLVTVWHSPTGKWCAALRTNRLNGDYWVIANWRPGHFNRDVFETLWFNLDRSMNARGLQECVQQSQARNAEAQRKVEALNQEDYDVRSYLKKKLPRINPFEIMKLW